MDWRNIPKLIDWRPIVSEMDAQLRRATSAMREQLGSVPRIVHVAYTNSEFRKIDEDIFREVTDAAKSVDVAYDIDKVYINDASAEATLRGHVLTLGADPSVHGIIQHGASFYGRDPPLYLEAIDPLKDIDCMTSTCGRWLKSGDGPFVLPTTGAILKILSYGLRPRPLAEVSVALLKGGWHPYASYPLDLLEVVLRCRSVTTYVDPSPDHTERVRRADAIVSQVGKQSYLDGRYVREGQIVIDVEAIADRSDADLDSVIPAIGAYANSVTVSNLKLRISFFNAMRAFLLKQDRRIASPLMSLVEIAMSDVPRAERTCSARSRQPLRAGTCLPQFKKWGPIYSMTRQGLPYGLGRGCISNTLEAVDFTAQSESS